MLDIKEVAAGFAVAPQIEAGDLERARSAGFGAVVNNRPDEEIPLGLIDRRAAAAAAAAGLGYAYIPVRERPPVARDVEAMKTFLAARSEPILAWCRSGTRSVQLWALAMTDLGRCSPREATDLAASAGYDLGSIGDRLRELWSPPS